MPSGLNKGGVTDLDDKLDFLSRQIAKVDRNVKCLALTDGANLALTTMLDSSYLGDFDKLRRATMPQRADSKILVKTNGSLQTHIVPVDRAGYQLVLVNNIHEVHVYKDYYGALPDEAAEEDFSAYMGNLKMITRLEIPHLSSAVIASDQLVCGCNLKNYQLQMFDCTTFELVGKSTTLSEAVTCICVGEPGLMMVGLQNSKVAVCKVGRTSIEVVNTFNLAHKIKTIKSIARTMRNDYVLGTQAGVCFGRYNPLEK